MAAASATMIEVSTFGNTDILKHKKESIEDIGITKLTSEQISQPLDPKTDHGEYSKLHMNGNENLETLTLMFIVEYAAPAKTNAPDVW